ncbi:hypothetical protein T06_1826 [Trichinella sp. T6]|nr:hypothetical protein T06_1826 [Trichinella sp. T6]
MFENVSTNYSLVYKIAKANGKILLHWSGFEILHIISNARCCYQFWQNLQCRMDQSERSMKFMSIIKLDRSSLNNIIQVCTSFGVVPWRKLFQS